MDILTLGIVAAVLHAAGYLVYGFKILRRDILPNPVSWLMFAYGTTLLVVLEWDRNASIALLALPSICAVSSIAVAWYSLRKVRRAWWPEHVLERTSFILDVLLTIAYISAWALLSRQLIGESIREIAVIVILLCWNVGIFTAFFPLLRQVYHHPKSEHFESWTIWTCAYAILAILTLVEQGGFNELFLYPALNAAVHGFIAIRVGYFHWGNRHTRD